MLIVPLSIFLLIYFLKTFYSEYSCYAHSIYLRYISNLFTAKKNSTFFAGIFNTFFLFSLHFASSHFHLSSLSRDFHFSFCHWFFSFFSSFKYVIAIAISSIQREHGKNKYSFLKLVCLKRAIFLRVD